LVKTFFFTLYNLLSNFSFYILLGMILVSSSMLFASLRKRFALFILTIILFSVWGFMLDLDGMMLVLLTAEFTIVLLFLMTYIQLYSNYEFLNSKNFLYYTLICLILLPIFYYPLTSFFYYTNFYSAINHVVASDFYILYYLLFVKLQILVILMTLIISFFSLFFIVVYYSLKFTKNKAASNVKNIYFLRKQILTKQTNFTTKLYTFQN